MSGPWCPPRGWAPQGNGGTPLNATCAASSHRKADDSGETDDKHVGLRVGECAEVIICLLACCVLQVQVHWAPVNCTLGTIVVEHCGDVLLGEGAACVACFDHSPFADHHTLDALPGGCWCCGGGLCLFPFLSPPGSVS